MRREPRLRRPAQAALLLRPHHLDRIAERLAGLRLHLHEREPAAAPRDEVELVAACPDVRVEDPVAAQEVVPPRPPLDGRTGGAGVQSSPAQ